MIKLGTGDDLRIFHDGSHSYIQSNTDLPLRLRSNTIEFRNKDNNKTSAKFIDGGTSEIYYDNSKKLETTSDGIKLSSTGDVVLELAADSDDSGEGDNPKIIMKQDGNNAHFDIGVEGTDGTIFTNSSANTPYLFSPNSGYGMEFGTNGVKRLRINTGGEVVGDFTDTSDGNLKKNITSIGSSIDKIKALRPVDYEWIDPTNEYKESGFIAQEVKTIYPNLVHGEEHTTEKPYNQYSLNTSGLLANVTKALQEAITKIETLETKVAALEAK